MELNTVLLSRLQFAFTIGFHILFPTLTIGLASFLVVLEGAWLATRDRIYLIQYRFWVRIFALAFGMGVVSGVVLSYEIGINFGRFSHIVGNVLGPLLSYEVLTAFFMEAGFLGIMLFGWERVGQRLHFVATVIVALGTAISAFWVLSANSWMHTPTGFAVEQGRFVPTNWLAVIFNPSFPYRFVHMMLAAYLTTAFAVAGVSAWYLYRGRNREFARRSYGMALGLALFIAPAQIVAGDLHGLEVQKYQPTKVAAMEALWKTRTHAPLVLFAWPDQTAETNRAAIEIPGGASLILQHALDGEVQGLDKVKPADRPNVPVVFFAFRTMVLIGVLFFGLVMWAAVQRLRGRLHSDRRLMRACMLASPLGFVATVAGWVVTEAGRQPWLVQGMLRTAEGISPVSRSEVMISLGLFVVVYGFLFAAFLVYLLRLIRNGPEEARRAKRPRALLGRARIFAERR